MLVSHIGISFQLIEIKGHKKVPRRKKTAPKVEEKESHATVHYFLLYCSGAAFTVLTPHESTVVLPEAS